jgi:hypothetical protein
MLMRPERDHPASSDKLVVGVTVATAESQRWAEPMVARLATEVWRLGRRLERVSASQADGEQFRPLVESLVRIEDVFSEHRIRTIDHDGQPYDTGLQVEVLHAREGAGTTAVILETVRPTVTLDGKVLQQGQVVIGPMHPDGGNA